MHEAGASGAAETAGAVDGAGAADAAGAASDAAGLDNSACPRCGGGFHCGVADGHCACFGLRLTDALKAQLSRDYPGQCLCLRCLSQLSQGSKRPTAAEDLTPD